MNPFIKAAILTVLVVGLAILVVSQLDAARVESLKKSVQNTMFENTERQVVQHYGQVLGTDPKSECKYLSRLRQQQFDSTYPLAQRIQDYEKNNLMNQDYESIKTTYFLGLTEIYLSGFENKKACGGNEIPLVLFYSEKTQCPECTTQNRLLPIIASRCPNVRIYAFPDDSDLAPLQMMVDRYNITKSPTIVIDDSKRLVGLTDVEGILAALKAKGAVCDSNAAPVSASANATQ